MRQVTQGWSILARAPAALGRPLCTESSSAGQYDLETFLKLISRPKMGNAKAKMSAGTKALDLPTQLSKLEGMAVDDLLKADGRELRRRGVPTQERKRILAYTEKVRRGWLHDGRARTKNDWKGWKPPLPTDPKRLPRKDGVPVLSLLRFASRPADP